MEGNEFVFKKEGTTLHVYLGFELSIANSAALREMFEAYRGQDISKIVFDATDLVFLSSSGIRVIIFATIQNTFKITGLVNFFSFVEDKSKTDQAENDEAEENQWQKEYIEARQKQLDNFAAHNDVVVYQMKLGQDEDE